MVPYNHLVSCIHASVHHGLDQPSLSYTHHGMDYAFSRTMSLSH